MALRASDYMFTRVLQRTNSLAFRPYIICSRSASRYVNIVGDQGRPLIQSFPVPFLAQNSYSPGHTPQAHSFDPSISKAPLMASAQSRQPNVSVDSIARLNLSTDPSGSSVRGSPSAYYTSEGGAPEQSMREEDGGVVLMSGPELDPQALRLPPAYRQFYTK